MINSKVERKAIYDVASLCTDFDWIFREQPIWDYGIDAFVETTTNDKRPSGIFFALQIKGGNNTFHKTKKGLTVYISDNHYFYWLEVNKRMPIFLIIQDFESNQIYWQQIIEDNIKQTNKKWKIEIPHTNKFDSRSRDTIQNIVNNHSRMVPFTEDGFDSTLYGLENGRSVEAVSIFFYLVSGSGKRLYCKISDDKETDTIELGYTVKKNNWDKEKNELSWDDPFYFTLLSLKKYIKDRYAVLKAQAIPNVIKTLRKDIAEMLIGNGIEGIAQRMFDLENQPYKVPEYTNFITAFENYTGLKKGQYTAQAVGHMMYFQTEEHDYEMNTYEGQTALLKSFIEGKSYDEIYTETELSHWNEIYIDGGIVKEKFIPKIIQEWENYWDKLYKEIQKDIGKTSHLDKQKNKSWRTMQAFMDGYNDTADVIEFAYELDDLTLYPLAVITMMNIFNPDVCYEEYCEFEFYGSGDWDSISLNIDDEASPIFHIKISNM